MDRQSMLKLSKGQTSHEERFMERYGRLRLWALRLVQGNPQQADDLLHDAFIHFMLHRAATEQAQNLDAYLHTMLRNLHLSQARRLARTPQGHLSLLDYDSADIGLQSVDPRDVMKVQDELRMICRYVCVRKESSKAASVLILRYFHGYYPAEIARLLQSPRMGIDGLLRNARGEARVFLQDPEALTFMRRNAMPEAPSLNYGKVSEDILVELRETLSAAVSGEHLSDAQFETLCRENADLAIDAARLSHLVSCRTCLDEVNRRLGWPSLQTRHATEMTGRDSRDSGKKGGGQGPTGGGVGAGAFLKRSRRRTKHVFEHRPKELHISVNGFVLGTQTVNSRESELTLNVNLDEKIAFVEVYSERDVRLFFLNVEQPPDGPVDQLSSVELSDGRTLDVALNFSETWPRLHAVYADPTLAEGSEGEFASGVPAVGIDRGGAAVLGEKKVSPTLLPSSLHYAELLTRAKSVFRKTIESLKLVLRPSLLARPEVVTVLVAVVLTGALLLLRTKSPVAPVSSAVLLQQAITNEQLLIAKPDQVIHRSFTLEERLVSMPGAVPTGSAPQPFTRHKIELWQDGSRKLAALRVYDQQNQLVSGQWTKDGLARVLLHHSRKLQASPAGLVSPSSLTFDDVWQVLPSPEAFVILAKAMGAPSVSETATDYAVTCKSTGSADGLQSATLVLSRPELRPIRQTLVIKQGSETREYTFIESSFELRPAATVAPAVFEPDPELVSSARRETPNSKLQTAASASALGPLPLAATADLEVEALRLLNQAGADLGEQVSVNRGRDGLLRITGVVETAARKAEIARALNSIINNPAVRYEVQTVTEVLARQRNEKGGVQQPVTVEGVQIQADVFPAYQELRKSFSDAEARAFASRMINRSHTAMRHAGALKRLLNQFSQEDLKGLSPEARGKWLSLIRLHAQAFEQETRSLHRELQPIFFSSVSPGGAATSSSITDDESLARAVRRLFDLGTANERVISSAFTTSSSGARTNTIHSEQFWQSLLATEGVAEGIGRAH